VISEFASAAGTTAGTQLVGRVLGNIASESLPNSAVALPPSVRLGIVESRGAYMRSWGKPVSILAAIAGFVGGLALVSRLKSRCL